MAVGGSYLIWQVATAALLCRGHNQGFMMPSHLQPSNLQNEVEDVSASSGTATDAAAAAAADWEDVSASNGTAATDAAAAAATAASGSADTSATAWAAADKAEGNWEAESKENHEEIGSQDDWHAQQQEDWHAQQQEDWHAQQQEEWHDQKQEDLNKKDGNLSGNDGSFKLPQAQGVGRTGGNIEEDVPPIPPPELKEIFMRYMPERNVVVCGCAKCGTSALYNWIFEKEFGQSWPYKGEPYIHELTSYRWQNRIRYITDWGEQAHLMDTAFTFALIRDPKERLVSAWKSKIACGGEYHTDFETRPWMTDQLRMLAGVEGVQQCMTLEEFLKALDAIHTQKKHYLLDRHFLPQNLGCFFRTDPEKWSKVISIEDSNSLAALSGLFGTNETEAPSEHSSTSKVLISESEEQLLTKITKHEYDLIGKYLSRPTRVNSGIWSLRQKGSRAASLAK